MTCGVYIIKNYTNNKCYVGSSVNIERRWIRHKTPNSSTCYKLRNAMLKHGIDTFYIEILEEVNVSGITSEELKHILLETEQKYLDLLQPFDSRGYNLCKKAGSTLGNTFKGKRKKPKPYKHTDEYIRKVSGVCSKLNKSVSKFSLAGEKLKTYFNITTAAKDNPGATIQAIAKCCKKSRKTAGNYLWAYEGEFPILKRHKSKKVCMYSLAGEAIMCFYNIKEAAEFIGKSKNSIYKCCRNEQDAAHGFIWKWIQ